MVSLKSGRSGWKLEIREWDVPQRDSATEPRGSGATELVPSQPLFMVMWGPPGHCAGAPAASEVSPQQSRTAGHLAAPLLSLLVCFHKELGIAPQAFPSLLPGCVAHQHFCCCQLTLSLSPAPGDQIS